MKKYIPNAITCGNLFCGCLALVNVFRGDMIWATYFVGIAVIFDFFDGFAARMLHVASPIGKDLDSLADMVTFGVVPGAMLYKLLDLFLMLGYRENYLAPYNLVPFLGFLISVFSGLRLAKFNNDTRQSDSFIGVPTPTNAILISSLVLILGFNIDVNDIFAYYNADLLSQSAFTASPFGAEAFNTGFAKYAWLVPVLCNPWFYIVYIFLFSYLLVSEIPLFALKFKNFRWAGNATRFTFLALSLLLILLFRFPGITLAIALYILLSVAGNFTAGRKSK